MTRRIGLLLVTTVLGIGPLPGCTLLTGHREDPMMLEGHVIGLNGEATVVRLGVGNNLPLENRIPADLIGESPGILGPPVITEAKAPVLPPPEEAPLVLSVQPAPFEPVEPVVTALHFFLKNQPTEALALLQKYDAQTQEVFLGILPTIGHLTQKGLDRMTMAEVATLQQQLQGVYSSLRCQAELIIDKACFCESIEGYGEYKSLPPDHRFQLPRTGHPGEQMRLYVELRNFHSEGRDGVYHTRLFSSVEIRDDQGERKWMRSFRDREKPLVSLAPRNDYFNHYSFFLPEGLRPGRYQLVIRINDETKLPVRTAEKAIDFHVAAAP